MNDLTDRKIVVSGRAGCIGSQIVRELLERDASQVVVYGLRPEQFSNAYLADRLSLALPLYVQMTEAEQNRVVAELGQAFPTRRE